MRTLTNKNGLTSYLDGYNNMILHHLLLISLAINNAQTQDIKTTFSKNNVSGSVNKFGEAWIIANQGDSSIIRKTRALESQEDGALFPEIIRNEDNQLNEEKPEGNEDNQNYYDEDYDANNESIEEQVTTFSNVKPNIQIDETASFGVDNNNTEDLQRSGDTTKVEGVSNTNATLDNERSEETILSENEEATIKKNNQEPHNFSSSGITILDNHTLILENFVYDGLSPDAHFYLNKNNLDFDNAVLIPDENGKSSKLKSYSGVNVTLNIEENVFNYDFLSVWCTLDKELIGFVSFHENEDVLSPYVIKTENRPRKLFEVATFDYTNEKPMKILSEFLNTSNAVSSGNLLVVNETSIYIQNFSFADESKEANFYIGIGENPSAGGQVVLLGQNPHLPKIEKENIMLTFPEETSVNDVDWLSVWSEKEKRSLGYVMVHSEVKPKYFQIPPMTTSEKYNYNIHSGPIIIIDTKTIFITNLHYDGKAPDAHFWAGSLQNGYEEGHLLFNEDNSSQPLSSYIGEDIYLTLPFYVDIKKIDYVAIWSSSLKTLLGVSYFTGKEDFSTLKEGKGLHEYNEDGKYIARLPKCCPMHQVKTSKGCINRIISTIPMRIYEGNLSYLNDEELQDVIYEPYLYQPNCEHGMFRMDMSEEFYLLTVGMMILPDGSIISKDKFCYDVSEIAVDEDVLSWNETMFMCFETEHVPEFLNTLMVTCIYISSFFLIVTSGIFIIYKKARAERGTNVMGYTTMMSLSFGCLATARILHVTGNACTVLGFIYQFFLVSSFTWLLCLSCDVFYQVWWYDQEYNKHRYKFFALFALCLPVGAVSISVLINSTVPSTYVKPTYGYEPCWLRSDKKVIFYYVPIGISIVLNYIFITLTWFQIKKRQTNPKRDWLIRGKEIKNIFRSCYLILGIMTICWTAEIISYYFETNNGLWIAIDVIDSLQGVFVFLVFVMHDPVIQIMRTQCNRKKKEEGIDMTLFNVPQRPPSEHGALLGRLQHAESVEDLCSIDNTDLQVKNRIEFL